MLSVKANFTMSDLEKDIMKSLNFQIDLVAQGMFEAGKKMVDEARSKTVAENSFNNITWNLRGSIGCGLLLNHQLSENHIYFPQVSKGELGVKTGEDYLREIALLSDDGDPVLIFVAGMPYARYVEATERDVITMSHLKFNQFLKSIK